MTAMVQSPVADEFVKVPIEFLEKISICLEIKKFLGEPAPTPGSSVGSKEIYDRRVKIGKEAIEETVNGIRELIDNPDLRAV